MSPTVPTHPVHLHLWSLRDTPWGAFAPIRAGARRRACLLVGYGNVDVVVVGMGRTGKVHTIHGGFYWCHHPKEWFCQSFWEFEQPKSGFHWPKKTFHQPKCLVDQSKLTQHTTPIAKLRASFLWRQFGIDKWGSLVKKYHSFNTTKTPSWNTATITKTWARHPKHHRTLSRHYTMARSPRKHAGLMVIYTYHHSNGMNLKDHS